MNKDLMPYNESENPFEGMMNLRDAMNQMMSEAIWDPFSSMITPEGEFEMMDSEEEGSHEEDEWLDEEFPKVDVKETAEMIIISAEIPGVKPDDFEVRVGETMVALTGITGYESDDLKDEEIYSIYERFYGTFERIIPMPTEIDTDKAVAEIENGVLTITVPKILPDVPAKVVPITVKSEGKTKKETKIIS